MGGRVENGPLDLSRPLHQFLHRALIHPPLAGPEGNFVAIF